MNWKAQQAAISDLMGWKYGNLDGIYKPIIPDYSSTGWFEPDGIHRDTSPPNFCSDLNAIRDAIKSQSISTQKAMRAEVWRLSSQMDVLPEAKVFAEALLRVLGKWVESEPAAT